MFPAAGRCRARCPTTGLYDFTCAGLSVNAAFTVFSAHDCLPGQLKDGSLSSGSTALSAHAEPAWLCARGRLEVFFAFPRSDAQSCLYVFKQLSSAAQPILENLSGVLHESCSVATLEEDELLYVARAHVSRIMTVDLQLEAVFRLLYLNGRVLLAHLPAIGLTGTWQTSCCTPYMRTIVSVAKLRKV